jgi:lipopolysaccharide export system protein LptA
MNSTASIRRVSASLKFAPIALGLAVIGLLVFQPVWARSDDRQQLMHVNSDKFDGAQQPSSISTLTGNVVIIQGTLKATGDRAKVYLDADTQISRIVIDGKLAHVEQQDDTGLWMHGEALNIDYNTNTDIAILTGTAYIQQQTKGDAHADRLVYNTNTSMMNGESGPSGQIHMTFEPKPVTPGAPGAKPATPAAPGAAKPAAAATPPAATSPAATPATTPAATPTAPTSKP